MKKLCSLFGLIALVSIAACGDDYVPDLHITPSDMLKDFGDQKAESVTTRTFDVENAGKGSLTLGEVSATALGISEPFALDAATTCTSGQELAKLGACQLVVRFEPKDNLTANQVLTMSFSKSGKKIEKTTTALKGAAHVDCTYTPDHPVCPEDMDLTFGSKRTTN